MPFFIHACSETSMRVATLEIVDGMSLLLNLHCNLTRCFTLSNLCSSVQALWSAHNMWSSAVAWTPWKPLMAWLRMDSCVVHPSLLRVLS